MLPTSPAEITAAICYHNYRRIPKVFQFSDKTKTE